MNLKVEESGKLLEYLYEHLDMPKKKIKSYLTNGCVYVNNTKTTRFDYEVYRGMTIKIETKKKSGLFFDILYEDDYIIVVNKPGGLLTIATQKEKENTLYHYVSNYLKQKNKKNRIFIVHRLDRETSGIVLFAKDEKTKNMLQKDWNSLVKVREYTTIVHGKMKKNKARLVDNLMETKTNYVYVSNKEGSKQAITNYQVVKENVKYSLLKINIETGRKNQIRVQLANINNPIVGDQKYGKKDSMRKLYLHANRLKLFYPIQKREITFKTEIPDDFKRLI